MKSRMTRMLGAIAVILAAYCSQNVYAQAPASMQQQNQQLGAQTLKPQMSVGDVVFVVKILEAVNINGGEVDAFIEVKSAFMKVLEQAQKDKKKEDDPVVVEMTYTTANNFLQLFQRATVPGSAAERFQGVKNAFVMADKANQGKQR